MITNNTTTVNVSGLPQTIATESNRPNVGPTFPPEPQTFQHHTWKFLHEIKVTHCLHHLGLLRCLKPDAYTPSQ